MKILKHTPTQLVLQKRPIDIWLAGSFIGSIALGLIGIWAVQPIKTILHCDRTPNSTVTCQLQSLTWMGLQQQKSVDQVIAVEQGERSRKPGSKPYRYLRLVTPTEKVGISNTQDQVSTISEIQAFLANSQSNSLVIEYRQFDLLILVLAGFAISLLIVALPSIKAPTIIWTFNQSTQKITLKRKVLGRTTITEYPIEAVQQVDIEKEQPQKQVYYRIVLSLTGTGQVLLTSGVPVGYLQQTETIAQSIREFLHLSNGQDRSI